MNLSEAGEAEKVSHVSKLFCLILGVYIRNTWLEQRYHGIKEKTNKQKRKEKTAGKQNAKNVGKHQKKDNLIKAYSRLSFVATGKQHPLKVLQESCHENLQTHSFPFVTVGDKKGCVLTS